MPLQFTGTPDDRRRRLEQRGKRCDGQDRTCVQTAIDELRLQPLKDGTPDGAEVNKKVCSRHRRIYDTAAWRLVKRTSLKAPEATAVTFQAPPA